MSSVLLSAPLWQMKVAVKFFIKAGETRDVTDILKRMNKGASDFFDTYRQIRSEVDFISKLQHPNLTHLEGVTMKPHPGLLLPLAPQSSLHHVLKEYSSANVSMLPLTMQASAKQVNSNLVPFIHMYVCLFVYQSRAPCNLCVLLIRG